MNGLDALEPRNADLSPVILKFARCLACCLVGLETVLSPDPALGVVHRATFAFCVICVLCMPVLFIISKFSLVSTTSVSTYITVKAFQEPGSTD